MKSYNINRYSYAELRRAAESGDEAAVNALGEWLACYDPWCWNGEYYDADGMEIVPVYDEDGAAASYEAQ